MERRGISETEVARVLSAPEQSDLVRPGRVVYQSRMEFDDAGHDLAFQVGLQGTAAGKHLGVAWFLGGLVHQLQPPQ